MWITVNHMVGTTAAVVWLTYNPQRKKEEIFLEQKNYSNKDFFEFFLTKTNKREPNKNNEMNVKIIMKCVFAHTFHLDSMRVCIAYLCLLYVPYIHRVCHDTCIFLLTYHLNIWFYCLPFLLPPPPSLFLCSPILILHLRLLFFFLRLLIRFSHRLSFITSPANSFIYSHYFCRMFLFLFGTYSSLLFRTASKNK